LSVIVVVAFFLSACRRFGDFYDGR
jgi:hypothetical protein